MNPLLNRSTIIMLITALTLVIACVLPETREYRVFGIIAMGMHVGDTLFHEMGHSIFHWLFGTPAVPMIFTIMGADQAGGLSMTFGEPNILVRLLSIAAAAYGCKWLKDRESGWFMPATIFTTLVVILGFTRYTDFIALYMGHGSSIAMGGFFLYRAVIYLDARGDFERWLNAFFGLYLIGFNFNFAYGLAFDPSIRAKYSDHAAFGAVHNDFYAMSEEIYGVTVPGVALFTMAYCAFTLLAALALSYYRRNDYSE